LGLEPDIYRIKIGGITVAANLLVTLLPVTHGSTQL